MSLFLVNDDLCMFIRWARADPIKQQDRIIMQKQTQVTAQFFMKKGEILKTLLTDNTSC